jgi:hypothetical protein
MPSKATLSAVKAVINMPYPMPSDTVSLAFSVRWTRRQLLQAPPPLPTPLFVTNFAHQFV